MKKIGFFLVFLAYFIRVISIFILKLHISNNPLFFLTETDAIALSILSGKGYIYLHLNTNYYFFAYPLSAYFLAFNYLITNWNYLAILILHAGIAAVSVIPLIFIANKAFNKRTALVSGLLYCLHPGLVVFSHMLCPGFILFVFFMLTITYLMVCLKTKKRITVAIGILTGLAVLTRPTLVFLIPAYLIYLIAEKQSLKRILFSLFVIVLLAAVIISPWVYRGYKIYNRFIFIALSGAENFWKGNNPVASGTGLTKDGQFILDVASEDFRNKLFSLNELGQYRLFKDEAIKYIKTHPVNFLKLTIKKFIYFWSFSPQTGLMYPKSWLFIYKILYLFFASFFIMGIYYILKNRQYVNMPIVVFLFFFFIMISLFQSLYYADIRHRWMIEPLLMIISGYGIVNTFFKDKASF